MDITLLVYDKANFVFDESVEGEYSGKVENGHHDQDKGDTADSLCIYYDVTRVVSTKASQSQTILSVHDTSVRKQSTKWRYSVTKPEWKVVAD